MQTPEQIADLLARAWETERQFRGSDLGEADLLAELANALQATVEAQARPQDERLETMRKAFEESSTDAERRLRAEMDRLQTRWLELRRLSLSTHMDAEARCAAMYQVLWSDETPSTDDVAANLHS